MRALISVYDKTNLVEFCKLLRVLGFRLISTGGTLKELRDNGVPVDSVSNITAFEEILEGRVKTLHPRILGAILMDSWNPEHVEEMRRFDIEPIELVVCNLYPFQEAMRGGNENNIIENIDIGGVTLLRAAAKNYINVCVVSDPSQYEKVIELYQNNKNTDTERRKFAAKAFSVTAAYDSLISGYFCDEFPDTLNLSYEKVQDCRYGENPHQRASFYRKIEPFAEVPSISNFEKLQGKDLSFNNINDANGALELLKEFSFFRPCVVIGKHANPCGVATGTLLSEAFDKALECDSKSAFGGIIALNMTCDVETACKITSFFNEIVMAPDYTAKALEELRKKKNLRVLKILGLQNYFKMNSKEVKNVEGGLLLQDVVNDDSPDFELITGESINADEVRDFMFGWNVVKHVKSNAIVIVKDQRTVAIGAGQMSRIDALEMCAIKGGDKLKGAIMISDAFFPFPDCVERANDLGITTIIQPGGSVNDNAVIKAAKRRKVKMLFTGKRVFKH